MTSIRLGCVGESELRKTSQCTPSVCRFRNKKHMDNTTQGKSRHLADLALTGRESGASIESFLDESSHLVAASLGHIVGSNTSAYLCLDMAHAERCLIIKTGHIVLCVMSPGVGLQIIPAEL